MTEKRFSIPYDRLLEQVCREYEQRGAIFGVSHIWKAKKKALPIFGGERIEAPIGPAAGPHTRLARNIIAAYAAGARFFELKTVYADGDGGDLTAFQAMDEYIKAWRILKVISEKYGLGASDGFVFSMGVGYTLKSVLSEEVAVFLDGMQSAGVSSSVTLSLLPGCPAEEIERAANHLIGERGLHTYIKFSPALLGFDTCRRLLDGSGLDGTALDSGLFRNALLWEDAVPMLRRLQSLAKHMNVEFGVKIADALPADAAAGALSADGTYITGRPLFPLAAELAARAARDFDGKLRISFSGGADRHNIEGLFRAGIWPVTMTSELLRPGGYNRMAQLAELLQKQDYAAFDLVNVRSAEAIAAAAKRDRWYKSALKPVPTRSSGAQSPLIDCFSAPCRDGCPIGQDIPAYVRLCGEGRYLEALQTITERNPLPNITGAICAQPCADRCTRRSYEGAVDIRGCKREAAEAAMDTLLSLARVPARNGKRAAVVGAGPAGISAAYFLAREGYLVTVFEKMPKAGGTVRRAVPSFHIDDAAIDRDTALAQAYGVNFCFGCAVRSAEELGAFDAVVLCVGAGLPGQLPLQEGQARNAVEFLASYKQHPRLTRLGRSVVVVGGGNTAMDAARAARRVFGVKNVTVVYRRDVRSMPANEAELDAALADGVRLSTLLRPVSWADKVLRCEVMELSAADASGRRSCTPTGECEYLRADALLAAVGQRPDTAFYREFGLMVDDAGRVVFDPETGRTSIPNVYLAGDGAAGPSTVAQAVAGAARAVRAICGADFEKYAPLNAAVSPDRARAKKGVFRTGCHESERCLECAAVCESCVDVCPNRANVAVDVQGRVQILHLDALCSRCGACENVCPWSSAPHEAKWTLFADEESFSQSRNQGFVPLGGMAVRVRFAGRVFSVELGESNGGLPDELAVFTRTVIMRYPDLIRM